MTAPQSVGVGVSQLLKARKARVELGVKDSTLSDSIRWG
jgi:hypothetical protein